MWPTVSDSGPSACSPTWSPSSGEYSIKCTMGQKWVRSGRRGKLDGVSCQYTWEVLSILSIARQIFCNSALSVKICVLTSTSPDEPLMAPSISRHTIECQPLRTLMITFLFYRTLFFFAPSRGRVKTANAMVALAVARNLSPRDISTVLCDECPRTLTPPSQSQIQNIVCLKWLLCPANLPPTTNS
jgi:hypothetical protein